jgi:hypothetical protein
MLAVGGALLLVASWLPWATAQVALVAGVDSARTISLAGREVAPGVAFAGWIALAGIGGVIAARGWGRVVVGIVLVVLGLGALAAAFWFAVLPGPAAESAARAFGVPASVAATGWWAMAALGGALVAFAGGWVAVRGRGWPALGRRYERAGDTPSTAWDALDRGIDPTDDPTLDPGDRP